MSHLDNRDFREIPTTQVLDDLVKNDNGVLLQDALSNGKYNMIHSGLCGLLYPDIGHLEASHTNEFEFNITEIRGKLYFRCGAPTSSLVNLDEHRFSRAGTSIVTGLAYAPTEAGHTRDMIKTILQRSDVIEQDPEKETMSIVFQGGARISDSAYQFAKAVGAEIGSFDNAPKKLITGGGRGIMRAPLSGAKQASQHKEHDDTKYCGISCGKIIAAEPPNSIVENLAVFEQIERRLEAFTRSGQLTVFFPGGTGTLEELLYVLAVQTEAKNRGIHYNYVLAGSEHDREYYTAIIDTLKKALGPNIIRDAEIEEKVCIGTPKEVGGKIVKEAQISQQHRCKEMEEKQHDPNVRIDFHGDIHIPSGLRTPFHITRESVRALKLDREQSTSEMIVNIRRFVYTVTCACVSTEKEEVEANGAFEVSGDAQITEAIDSLLQYFVSQKRMNGGTYVQPYKLVAKS